MTAGPCITSLIHSSPALSKAKRRGSLLVGSPGLLSIRPCRDSRRCTVAGARLGRRFADQEIHRERRCLLLERAQQVRHLLRNGPRTTLVAPGLGMKRREAAAAIQGQPFTQRLRGHAASPRARDLVHLLRLLAEQGVEAALALLSMRKIGDQTVPEERDPLSCLVVKRHFRLLSPDKRRREESRRQAPGGSGPVSCWVTRSRSDPRW